MLHKVCRELGNQVGCIVDRFLLVSLSVLAELHSGLEGHARIIFVLQALDLHVVHHLQDSLHWANAGCGSRSQNINGNSAVAPSKDSTVSSI